jgi:hypothetical protein
MTPYELKAKMVAAQAKTDVHAARLNAYNETQSDWRSTCRYCGVTRVGTLAFLRAPCTACNKAAVDWDGF